MIINFEFYQSEDTRKKNEKNKKADGKTKKEKTAKKRARGGEGVEKKMCPICWRKFTSEKDSYSLLCGVVCLKINLPIM